MLNNNENSEIKEIKKVKIEESFENENKIEKEVVIDETKKISKKSKFLKKNIFFIFLILFTFFIILVNYHDKKNTSIIKTTVDSKLTTETQQLRNSQKKLLIYVYNTETKKVEEKEITILHQPELIEGDYINQIIKNSSFITENMKFQSAYIITQEGKKTLKVVLNSMFESLESNKELFDGFSKSVEETIKKQYPDIQEVKIEIDGVN